MKFRSAACTLGALTMISIAPVCVADDHVAVLELGAELASELPMSGTTLAPTVAVEVTPIENWLELEFGVARTRNHHAAEWDADLLFKKPWTWSSTIEFMAGLGPTYSYTSGTTGPRSTAGVEFALDFMFWPKQRWGWFIEPAYGIDMAGGRGQSISLSFGLLLPIG